MKQFTIGFIIIRVWIEVASGSYADNEFTLLNFGVRLFGPIFSVFLVFCGLGIRIQIGGK